TSVTNPVPYDGSDYTRTGVDKTPADIPGTFSLSQNYPNPFNPTTAIAFSLPEKSFVSLKVFGLDGRQVATLVSEELPAGSHLRQWNALHIPSGIYFYCLQAGKTVETKKLILLK
ncbi:MAG TPA: T9SS type A sorting domain-containing protein, partial [bacterium]